MSQPNENCLAGMRCPKCKSYGPFRIAIAQIAIMTDDGVDEYDGDNEWQDDSYCGCLNCDHEATVKQFTQKEPRR